MPNTDANWTTVSGKAKAKAAPSSTKSSTAPAIPKAEEKTIKLSDSAFSSMKDRIPDENDENRPAASKAAKPALTNETSAPTRATKAAKSTSNAATLKQTLQNLNVDKLKELYTSSKDQTAVWVDKICYWFIEQLKEVTSGSGDQTFAKETTQDYPLSALPTALRDYLKEIFDHQSKLKAIKLCREGILSAKTDANGAVGYQTLLQYFFRHLDERPGDSFLADVDELSTALKRYPMDKVLRVLWAYGQLQYEQPGLALDVWFRLMFPLIENRTYNEFVAVNLAELTSRGAKSKKFLRTNDVFPVESFVGLLDFIERPNPALTREMRASLSKSAHTLSELFLSHKKNLSHHATEYFAALFPHLYTDKPRSAKTQTMIDRMTVACVVDPSVVKKWLALHKKFPQSSLNLLSLLQSSETPAPALSSSKELRTIMQQLRTISNEDSADASHNEFLRVYAKNDTVVVSKRKTRSKSRTGSVLKWLVFLFIAFTVYSNWLWLTVAADYLLEDYMKHPTAVAVRQSLSDATREGKELTMLWLKHGEEFVRSTLVKTEPYVIHLGQYVQKQWVLALRYIEGPVYDKSVEIAEQIQRLSIVIFNQSVHYLNILFHSASYYTAHLAGLTEVYLKQVCAILYDKWTHFDFASLLEKFDQLKTRWVKSV